MSYKATPLPWYNLSPTQLLMGRRIRTVVPEADGVLVPSWPNLMEFQKVDEQYKKKQKSQFDKRQELPEFDDNTEVFITDGRNPTVPGRVIQSSGTRSYIVETTSHRNRCHLHQRPSDTSDIPRPIELRSPVQTRSETGTVLRPPNRLTY